MLVGRIHSQREGRQEGDAAFCQYSLTACYYYYFIIITIIIFDVVCVSVEEMSHLGHLTVCLSCLLILSGATVTEEPGHGTGSDLPKRPELLRDDRGLVNRQRVSTIQELLATTQA